MDGGFKLIPHGGLFGGRLLVFDALPSTNQWLLDHAAERGHGDAVRAINQTAGRGRFQRRWIAPAGRALTVSVILKPGQPQDPCLPVITPIAALAVRATLEKCRLAALLKWPNDVVVGGRKIAGILAERESETGVVVLGLGVNVNLTARDLPQDKLLQAATSIRIETGRSLSVNSVCAELLLQLQSIITRAAAQTPAFVFELWRPHDFLDGKRIEVQTPQGPVSGACHGMDPSGRLRLLDDAGAERLFWSGDVSVREEAQRQAGSLSTCVALAKRVS